MQGGTLDVAVAEAEFLRPGAGQADPGVVVGNAAVVMQADDRSGVVVEALGAFLVAPLAEGDVEMPLAVKHQA